MNRITDYTKTLPIVELYTAVRQNRYYSEDWTFCENWRDIGGRIWVDKRVLLRHSGSYVFCQENQEHLMKTIGPMYVDQLTQQGIKLVDKDGNEAKINK